MKIALVTLQGNPFGQTPEAGPDRQDRRLASLVSALAEQDHDVTVYARRDSEAQPEKSEPAPGVTVEHVPAGPPGSFPRTAWPRTPRSSASTSRGTGRTTRRTWRTRTSGPAGSRRWPVPATWACRSCRPSCRCRPAIRPRSRPSSRPGPPAAAPAGGAARLRLEPVIARSVRAVLASSSSEMSTLARLGVRRDSVRLIPRGVDTGTFSPEGPVAQRGSRPRLLCVAPLAPNQGVDVAVRALADIPEAELVIAGGPEHGKLRGDKAYRALLRLASELNVRDRVIFHGGVSDAELPALLRSADLLVDAPTGEPFATVALEAMACGTPVVASAIGSHLDTIIDGTTGTAGPAGPPRADRPADPHPAG